MKTQMFLLFAVSCINSFAQTTLIQQPNAANGIDAEVWNLSQTANFGTSPFMRGNAWTWGGNPGLQRSYVQFDLSTIPVNATVIDARLSLFAVDSPSTEFSFPSSGSNAAYIARVTSGWNESTLTWNTQPSVTTLNQVLIPQSTSGYQDYLNIDVTQLVSDMVANPANSFGFRLSLQTESIYRRLGFSSSDATDPNKHPKLEVTYNLVGAIADNPFESRFALYPNPSSGHFNIEKKSITQDSYTLRIFDTNGKTIKETGNINETLFRFDLDDVVPGIYFVQLNDGKNTFGKMIVKN